MQSDACVKGGLITKTNFSLSEGVGAGPDRENTRIVFVILNSDTDGLRDNVENVGELSIESKEHKHCLIFSTSTVY